MAWFFPTGKDSTIALHCPPSQTRREGTKVSKRMSFQTSGGAGSRSADVVLLLTPFFSLLSDASEIALPPGSGITVLIKPGTLRLPDKPCSIIVSKRLTATLLIKPGVKTGFSFSCQNPENHFVIEIQKNIGKYTPVDCWSPCLSFLY